MSECPTCDDFHWLPAGEKPGWYARDWRILLDPTVEWVPCPDCEQSRPVISRLQDSLVRMIIRRIEEQVDAWGARSAWAHGLAADGQVVWRHGTVYALPPGLLADLDAWTLVSELGIMRGLDLEALGYHLDRAGLPAIPD